MNVLIDPSHNPEEKVPFPTADESAIRRILVVDDEPNDADTLAELLNALGWQGKAVYSAKEALDFLENYTPDLIFLDIGMPEMNGYDLVRALRKSEKYRNLPIVAVTGYGMEKDKIEAIQLGFTAHLAKPISARDLREILTGDIGA